MRERARNRLVWRSNFQIERICFPSLRQVVHTLASPSKLGQVDRWPDLERNAYTDSGEPCGCNPTRLYTRYDCWPLASDTYCGGECGSTCLLRLEYMDNQVWIASGDEPRWRWSGKRAGGWTMERLAQLRCNLEALRLERK